MTEQANVTGLNDQVRQEHEELRSLLRSVHQMLTSDASPVEQVRANLRTLSEHVAGHFKQEETDGFFDQIVQDVPRLSSRVEALRIEHTHLLEVMHGLKQELVSDEPADSWRKTLEQSFHEFSRELMAHESKENELLQDAYGTDIGSKD